MSRKELKITVSRDKLMVTGKSLIGTRTAIVGTEYKHLSRKGHVIIRLVGILNSNFVMISTTSKSEKGHAHTGERIVQMRNFLANYIPVVRNNATVRVTPKPAEVTRISDAAVLAEMRKLRDRQAQMAAALHNLQEEQREVLALVRGLAAAWKVDAQEG